MRLRSIFSEAYRNVVSGTTRGLALAAALAATSAGLAIADARSIIDLQAQAADFVASGASVRVLVARGTTDAAACERLGAVAGFRSAGALKPADPIVLQAMIANPIQGYAVTPGLIKVLGGDTAARAGAWIPAQLAATLAVRPGQTLASTAGPVTIAGVYDYPEDGRDSRLTYAALLPQPATGTFDECWADVWPVSRSRDSLLHAAVAVDATSTDPVTVGQLNTSRGARFDGDASFAARPTRHALPGCLAAGLLLGFLAIRIRRLEIAAALHLGVTRRAVLATLLIETAAWAFAALALAACALVVGVTLHNPAPGADVYLIDIRGPVVTALATLGGAVLASATIREKHLFGYFKNR
jgi:hypothetical protein